VLANLPYKFAILEASHKGAKNPKYFTESSFIKRHTQFTVGEIEQFFVQCLIFFLYLFCETIL